MRKQSTGNLMLMGFLRIYRRLQIHEFCQNGADAKDLLYQNMFDRDHSKRKKKTTTNSCPLISSVPPNSRPSGYVLSPHGEREEIGVTVFLSLVCLHISSNKLTYFYFPLRKIRTLYIKSSKEVSIK